MIKSVEIICNRIEQEKIIRKQWQQVIIKSADKKGIGEELNKNKRGLFLVNIVSQAYEKVKKKKDRMKLNTTKCQICKQQAKKRDQQWATL